MINEYVRIWRVENEHGCGPYAQSGKGNIHVLLHDTLDGKYVKIPLPNEDIRLSAVFEKANSAAYLSGFSSLEQYARWFDTDEIRELLDRNNFYLKQYAVPENQIVAGKAQILFQRDGAIETAVRRCTEPVPISARSSGPPSPADAAKLAPAPQP